MPKKRATSAAAQRTSTRDPRVDAYIAKAPEFTRPILANA